MDNQKETEVKPESLWIRCPECGGKYAACLNPSSLVHSLPICERFETMGILDFMKWARENGARVIQ